MSETLQTKSLVQQKETYKNKFLTFTIGKESYVMEIMYVRKIKNEEFLQRNIKNQGGLYDELVL